MITVKYPDGRVEQRAFVRASGENPIGSDRPLPDGAVLEIMGGCVQVTEGEGEPARVWPWGKITELSLGPVIESTEETILREGGSTPF